MLAGYSSSLRCAALGRRCLSTSLNAFSAATNSKPKSNLAKLRKNTGYSLSLCKQALEKNEQDFDKALSWLKVGKKRNFYQFAFPKISFIIVLTVIFQEQALAQGWAKAQKLEGRNASQGLIGLLTSGDSAAMVEMNCETDFVSRNASFHKLLETVTSLTLKGASEASESHNGVAVKQSTKDDLSALKDSASGQTVADLVALDIGQIGENIVARRGVSLQGAGLRVAGVTHPSGKLNTQKLQYGRYAAVVAYTVEAPGSGQTQEDTGKSKICSV